MAKKKERAYSRYTDEAIRLLAGRIKAARFERGITMQELSERANISRGLLRRIENGDPACAIGVVFEVATLLGLTLLQSDQGDIFFKTKEKLSFLEKRVRKLGVKIDNDF